MERLYLETMLIVMKTGSFSKAASLLCITQSAVSHRVKFLEERLGCQLIDRSGPELVPTEAGKCVIKKAEQILQLENELKKEISRLDQRVQLSIATTATFGSVYLPQVMSNFFMNQTERADLRVAVKTPAEIRKGLLCNDYDMAIAEHLEDFNLPDFVVVSLPPDELVFASANHLNENPQDFSLCQLTGQRLIARPEGCSCHQLLKINLKTCGLDIDEFRSVAISDDISLMINTIRNGKGISYISKSLIKDDIKRGAIQEYHVPGFKKFRSRSLIFKKIKIKEEVPRFLIENILNLFDIPLAQIELAGDEPRTSITTNAETDKIRNLAASRSVPKRLGSVREP